VTKRKSTTASGSFDSDSYENTSGIDSASLWLIGGMMVIAIIAVVVLYAINSVSAGIAIAIIAIIVVGDISVAIWIRHSKRTSNRRSAIEDWAESQGFKFRSIKDFGIGNQYYDFRCFQGDTRSYFASNIIDGTFSNRKFCTFDYLHEIDVTSNSSDSLPIGDNIMGKHILSAVIMETGLSFKPLVIRPERLIDKIAESAGLDDISFESTEFNSKFHVKSSDRRWAYDIVNQATMDLLLDSPPFIMEFQDNRVMAYRHDTFSLGDIKSALKLITGILGNLPKSLFHEKKVGKL